MADEHLLTTAVPSFTLAWKSLLLDHRVTDGAVRLYLVLATYARPDRPVAWPGQEQLARQMNVSLDTIQRAGTVLVDTGWIEKVRRGRGRSNVYHLRMPGAIALAVDKAVTIGDESALDTADVRLQETADLRLPYEVEPGEVENTPTPLKVKAKSTKPSKRPLGEHERSEDFALWWESYPRKIGKIEAEAAWRQMIDRLPVVEQLIDTAIELGRRTAREHPEAGEWLRYVPHPSTWLRRGDYLDVDGLKTERPPTRNPCVLCGVSEPTFAKCLGPGKGLCEPEDCIWKD